MTTDDDRRLARKIAAQVAARYRSGDKIHAMPWTREQMTKEELGQWVASRKEVGRAIDIKTCELGCWYTLDLDPYIVHNLPEELQQIGKNYFVRSPESRGWVHAGDLPDEVRAAMYERMELQSALFYAAAEKHPGWHLSAAGYAQKVDPEAPEYSELIEWFRISFPREARATEVAIGDDRLRRGQLADTEPPF
jgi:hypothetical protein